MPFAELVGRWPARIYVNRQPFCGTSFFCKIGPASMSPRRVSLRNPPLFATSPADVALLITFASVAGDTMWNP